MAKVKDCPGFETFGADVKEARKAKNLARKDLAEKVNIDTRYLANIENEGTILSNQHGKQPLTISATRKRRTESCLFPPMAAPPKLRTLNLPGLAATPSTRERTWADT